VAATANPTNTGWDTRRRSIHYAGPAGGTAPNIYGAQHLSKLAQGSNRFTNIQL
jgi:hypothetical protein